MDKQRAKELLPIIQAFAEGKEVEFKQILGSWAGATSPTFMNDREYRVKPEPLVLYVNVYDTGKADKVYEAFEDEENARAREIDCLSSYVRTFKMVEAE